MGNLNQKVVQRLASTISYNKIAHRMPKPDTAIFRKTAWLSTLAAYHGNGISIVAHSQMIVFSAGWVGAIETVVEH